MIVERNFGEGREERPGVQPIPFVAQFGGDAEFGFALLQVSADFVAAAAQEVKFQAVELAPDLVEMRNQKR